MRHNVTLPGVLLLLCFPAAAHDFGCDHTPVPENIKRECCGKSDAHLVGPDNPQFPLRQLPNGDWQLTVGDKQHVWKETEVMPANDGCYRAWWGLGDAVENCSPEEGACQHPKYLSERPIMFYCLAIPFTM